MQKQTHNHLGATPAPKIGIRPVKIDARCWGGIKGVIGSKTTIGHGTKTIKPNFLFRQPFKKPK